MPTLQSLNLATAKLSEAIGALASIDTLVQAYQIGAIDEHDFRLLAWAQRIGHEDAEQALIDAHIGGDLEGFPKPVPEMGPAEKATDWYKKFPRKRRTPLAPKLKGHPLDGE